MSTVQKLADHLFRADPDRRTKFEAVSVVEEVVIDIDKLISLCENALKDRGRTNLLGSVAAELKEIFPVILPIILEALHEG